MATSIRELSFQMVLDTILKPAGVKVGGFPEEMFLDLSDEEQEKWACNICFLLVKDCHECRNKHLFCHSCIVAWTMTTGQNSQRCPFCRCEQTEYASNKAIDRLVEDKRVTCPHDDCTFTAPLKIFLLHSHGRMEYSNANIDLESLRSQHLVMPGLMTPDDLLLPSFARMQVLQGRVVAQQIRLLLHLEFWLRHQALIRFTRAPDHESQVEGLDEVIQLSEQLNEVGSVLSSVFASDVDGMLAGPRRLPAVGSGRGAVAGAGPLTRAATTTAPSVGRANTIRNQSLLANLADEDDSDTSSLASSRSGVVSAARRDFVRQLESSATATASYAERSNWGSSYPPPHRIAGAASNTPSASPRVSGPTASLPSSRTLSHRLLERPHDASRSLVTRESSDTTPSSAVTQQSAEHVTGHVTDHVTFPRVSPLSRLTGNGSGNAENVLSTTALRDRPGVTASVAAAAGSSRVTAPSPSISPSLSGSSLSLLDTSTASSSLPSREVSAVNATMRRPTGTGASDATRQSSEPVGGRVVNTASQPAATTPRTSQITTGATTRQNTQPPTDAMTTQSSQPATGTTKGRTSKPVAGATSRRTSQPSHGTTTRQLSQPSTGATTRRTSQPTRTRQPVPPRGSVPGTRPGPTVRQPATGATTRLISQQPVARQAAPPRGSVAPSRTEAPTRQVTQPRQSRNNVSNSTTGAPPTNTRLPTTPGQLMRARRRSEISQEIADNLRKTHDPS